MYVRCFDKGIELTEVCYMQSWESNESEMIYWLLISGYPVCKYIISFIWDIREALREKEDKVAHKHILTCCPLNFARKLVSIMYLLSIDIQCSRIMISIWVHVLLSASHYSHHLQKINLINDTFTLSSIIWKMDINFDTSMRCHILYSDDIKICGSAIGSIAGRKSYYGSGQ